jgi:hypothetical protein
MNATRPPRRIKILPILTLAFAVLACAGEVPIINAPTATHTSTLFPTSIPLTDTLTPTVTATLRPSSTALPTLTLAPSLTAVPTLTPSPGVIGVGLDTGPFKDDFSDPLSGWPTEEGDLLGFGYFNGGYRMYNNMLYSEVCTSRTRFHTDFVIGVQATKLSGPNNAYFGVSCRKTGNNYYTLAINGSGQYKIYKTVGGVINLLSSGENGAIRQGDQTNVLVGSCIGTRLTLVVNGVEVISIQDPGPLFGSMIGLVIGTTSEPGIEVKFDNFDSFPVAGAAPFPTGTLTTTPGTPTASPTTAP